MGQLGGLSPGGSVAVRHDVHIWLNANMLTLVFPADWYTGRSSVDKRTKPWLDPTTKVSYSRRRERSTRCTKTATSTEKMAAGNGHVHYLEYTGKHNSDNDTPSSSIVYSSSFRPCLQFHMRHLDPRRAFHQMVLRRDITGLQRRSLDCCFWCHPGACT